MKTDVEIISLNGRVHEIRINGTCVCAHGEVVSDHEVWRSIDAVCTHNSIYNTEQIKRNMKSNPNIEVTSVRTGREECGDG